MTESYSKTRCPSCGWDGAFDGQGSFSRETKTHRLDGDGINVRHERWYQMRCGECGQVFATRDRVKNVTLDEPPAQEQ